MNDDYDLDNYDDIDRDDEDFDSTDEFDDDENFDPGLTNELDDDEIAIAGSLDGELDGGKDALSYDQFGSSVDLDDLTDEQREIYDNAYSSSHDTFDDEDDF